MRRMCLLHIVVLLFAMYPSADANTAPDLSQYPNLKVIVNIPERVLRIYDTDKINDFSAPLLTYKVAVGQKRFPTPTFSSRVMSKRAKPAWYVPRAWWAGELAGQVIPFNHHENPFRARNEDGRPEGYFLALGVDGVGLHSTREARSIGKLASHGCIRMRLQDVRHLFQNLPEGTPVDVSYKLFRLEQADTGLVIHAFEDVYRRMDEEERREHLFALLESHRIPAAVLTSGEIDLLLAGKTVTIGGFDAEPAEKPVVINYPSPDIRGAVGVSEAAEVLARTVSMMRP